MKTSLRSAARAAAIAAALAVPLAHAQSEGAPQPSEPAYASQPAYAPEAAAFSAAELDQMLAPLALYPDELLSQILMAATYPLEVVEAGRWSRANPGLQGDDAVSAVNGMDWDPSVKSLVAFPQVLSALDGDLDWTQRLGEAFLAQQDGVMASVQRLRRAAMNAGNLASNDEMVVSQDGSDIALDSPSPDTMYVPYYDPRSVYGSWWWPASPPVYWSPWPGYAWAGDGFAWTVGVPVGVDFFFGDFDWRRRHVSLHDHRPFYDHDRDYRDHQWRFDPRHRRNVPFHNPVARRDFAGATAPRTLPHTANGSGRGNHQRSGAQAGSAIARPGTMRPVGPLGATSPREPQGGFFPQQPIARPAQRVERGNGQPYTRERPQYTRPQPSTQSFARGVPSQPLARPAQPIARPAQPLARPVQPVPRSVPAQPPAMSHPQPIARPAPAQPLARTAPAPAQPQEGEAPRSRGR